MSNIPPLTHQRVDEIAHDCLYTQDEIEGDLPPDDAVRVKGIVREFGFHPGRLESYRAELTDLLDQLPPQFHSAHGGGWTFLNMGMCANSDELWSGDQSHYEALMCLGMGLGLVKYLLPREVWKELPGGMPFIQTFPEAEPPTPKIITEI